MRYARLLVFALALCGLAYALIGLRTGQGGVSSQDVAIGAIPATVFAPPQGPPKAIVIVAHGFAGSQQMMAPIATTLARDGYLALTFDFAGHGRNELPMHGGVAKLQKSTGHLLDELDEVAAYARSRPEYNGRLALVGHSMASELVVQSAMRRDDIAATVALSLFGREVTATRPKNLLVIDGAWEFAALQDAARRIVGLTAPDPQERQTYGDFASGTARRYAFAAGAEHIGVIWSLGALEETRDWLDAAFGAKTIDPGVDRRGPYFVVLFFALAALLRLGIGVLPSVADRPPAAPLSRGRFYALISAAAVATPLLLWKAPTDFLPILLGDYLAAHFALWGALLWTGVLWLGARAPSPLTGEGWGEGEQRRGGANPPYPRPPPQWRRERIAHPVGGGGARGALPDPVRRAARSLHHLVPPDREALGHCRRRGRRRRARLHRRGAARARRRRAALRLHAD